MASIALEIQKAIVDLLAGLTVESAQTGGVPNSDGSTFSDGSIYEPTDPVPVYDHAPENASYPFVALSSQNETPLDTLDAFYAQHTIYLSVWSSYRGQAQVLTIMSSIHDRLHMASLTLATGDSLLCRVTSQIASREPDGITYQGAMIITVIAAH
jgi:Protein of unknown function (DUF3168)